MGQLERELVEEWLLINGDETKKEEMDNLLIRIETAMGFNLQNNSEIQACDVLMDIDKLDLIDKYLDSTNCNRVCQYLISCVPYLEGSEGKDILKLAMGYYLKFKQYPEALCVAMQLADLQTIKLIFNQCTDLVLRKQLSFMVGRQQISIEIDDELGDKSELDSIMTNSHINGHFLNLARELDILEPKTPEEVYKTWLETLIMRPKFNLEIQPDSARSNLASTFVNAFVNAGFSVDSLVTVEDGSKWMYKNKNHGMISAAASLGLIHLWDVDGGLTPIDKYLYTSEDNIKAGALMALGLVNCGVRNECDPALALLADFILHNSVTLRIGAVFGLGLAYAGSQRKDVVTLLYPVLSDEKTTPEVRALTALSIGLICVGGNDNHEALATLLQTLYAMKPNDLNDDPYAKFVALGLGFCVMGKKSDTEALDAALMVLQEPFLSLAQQMIQMCAFAGSGDVLVIQKQLHICSKHSPSEKTTKEKKKDDKRKNTEEKYKENSDSLSPMQGIAALSVAVVSMGEDIGSEMTNRIFGQLGRFGEPAVRRAVPLALALSSISNPQMTVLDILNKYSHDADEDVAHNAILAMGLVGAGSNSGRLSVMLRYLAQYYAKNPLQLFMVRVSQGLVHLGKGTLTLNPFHTDRQVMNPVAIAGLLITLVSFVDCRNVILNKSHYLMFSLATAMYPRWLVTLDENLNPLNVSVRVGQAVDVIGKAGTPKSITGVRTHTTPVLLAVGEKAELATEAYTPLTPVMEGFVILRKVE